MATQMIGALFTLKLGEYLAIKNLEVSLNEEERIILRCTIWTSLQIPEKVNITY